MCIKLVHRMKHDKYLCGCGIQIQNILKECGTFYDILIYKCVFYVINYMWIKEKYFI